MLAMFPIAVLLCLRACCMFLAGVQGDRLVMGGMLLHSFPDLFSTNGGNIAQHQTCLQFRGSLCHCKAGIGASTRYAAVFLKHDGFTGLLKPGCWTCHRQ